MEEAGSSAFLDDLRESFSRVHARELSAEGGVSFLLERWGGQRVYVTTPTAAGRPDREREILRLRGAGESVERIASSVGLSERRVYQILRLHSSWR